MISKFLAGKLIRAPFFNWLLSIFLGELSWIRKIRNRLSRSALARNYSKWIEQSEHIYYDLPAESELSAIKASPPILILYRLDEFLLESVTPIIKSLQIQKYPKWDLHIFSRGNSTVELQQTLNRDLRDGRSIKFWNLQEVDIEGNTLANKMKQSDFQLCLILDENMLLHPRALYEIVKSFRLHPNVDFIYTDEDLVTLQGARHSPWFKPDWSPELLYSVNYLKPILINQETLNRIDTFWSEFLVGNHLNAILNYAIKRNSNVLHLSKILFHIRSRSKEWRYDAPQQTGHEKWVENHLSARGLSNPKVERGSHEQIRATWSTSEPLVSIIIPTKDNLSLLNSCITSLIQKTAYENYDITIIDTGSTDSDTWQYYAKTEFKKPVSILRYQGEFNYSAVNNFGARETKGKHLLFLNNDVETLDKDWLEELVRWIELPEIGVVGAKLLYPDRSIQHFGVVLGLGGHAGHVFLGAEEREIGLFGSTNWYRNFLAVTGACMMVDRKVFNDVGGFDEAYQLVFSDVDLCLRIIKNGYRVIVSPFARLIHRVGSTRQRYSPKADLTQGFTSFLPYLEGGDPYYNHNLSYSDPFPKLGFTNEMNRVERVRRIAYRK